MKFFILFLLSCSAAFAGLLDRPAPNLAASNTYNGNFVGRGSSLSNTTSSANVRDYGAIGDGTNNDTAAFLSAYQSGRRIYAPAGRYSITSLWLTNTTLYGDGPTTILEARYQTNLVAILNVYEACIVRDLTLRGSNSFAWGSASATTGIRYYGLVHDATGPGYVSGCLISGFDTGILVYGNATSQPRDGDSTYIQNSITNCWNGISLALNNRAEYTRVLGNSVRYCRVGIWNNTSANVLVTANKIIDCTSWGLWADGDVSTRRGHSLYLGNQINHTGGLKFTGLPYWTFRENVVLGASINTMTIDRCTNGTLAGNQFEFGTAGSLEVVVTNSSGISMTDNMLIANVPLNTTGSTNITLTGNRLGTTPTWGGIGTYIGVTAANVLAVKSNNFPTAASIGANSCATAYYTNALMVIHVDAATNYGTIRVISNGP